MGYRIRFAGGLSAGGGPDGRRQNWALGLLRSYRVLVTSCPLGYVHFCTIFMGPATPTIACLYYRPWFLVLFRVVRLACPCLLA